MIVRLKVGVLRGLDNAEFGFNSMIVRLKDTRRRTTYLRIQVSIL